MNTHSTAFTLHGSTKSDKLFSDDMCCSTVCIYTMTDLVNWPCPIQGIKCGHV